MDKRFTDWYQTVDPNRTEDRLKKRWAGIESFISTASIQQALDAVRVFYGLTPEDPTFIEEFSDQVYQSDNAFSSKGAEREIAILAGIAAFTFAKEQDELSIFLSISCCRSYGIGPLPPLGDIVKLSEDHLIEASKELRNRTIAIPNIKEPQKVLDTFNGSGTPDHNHLKNQTSTALTDTLQQQQKLFGYCQELHDLAILQKEELDIMWWLYGEYSRTADKYFAELSSEEACIALALDACELTHNSPGPMGIKAYLKKGLASCNIKKKPKLTLRQLANKTNTIVRDILMQDKRTLTGLTPIYRCLKNYYSNGVNSEWSKIDNYNGVTLNIEQELDAVDLAYQIYKESLLIKTIASLDEEE